MQMGFFECNNLVMFITINKCENLVKTNAVIHDDITLEHSQKVESTFYIDQ